MQDASVDWRLVAYGAAYTLSTRSELGGTSPAGSEATVRLYVTGHRQALDEGLPPPAPDRSAFEVSRLLMTRPECGMCETTDQTCRSLSG